MRSIGIIRTVCDLRTMCFTMVGILSAVFGITGCAVGPDYVKPETATPSGWQEVFDPAPAADGQTLSEWWKVFHDPLLTELIVEAKKSNLDLRQAVARVKEARAQFGLISGERFSRVDATGEVNRSRLSENDRQPGGATTSRYGTGLDLSWEIDLFGRIRRSVEAAAADFEASAEDYHDVMITLSAEVAKTYLLLRTFQMRLASSIGNIESQKQILQLTRSRFKYGLATDLDVAQAEEVFASSEAELPPLRANITQAMNNLALLLGKYPGALSETLGSEAAIPVVPEYVAMGVPADLLRRRPDIRSAERELAAQTARIGVATADLYPRFSLAGSFGWAALDSGDVLHRDSREWNLIPGVRWNVFDAGRIRSQITVEDARTEQALARYERIVLTALNEVENSLKAYREERIRVSALERSVAAAQRTLRLSTKLYKEGLADFQNVLDAQRSLFSFENQLAEARGTTAVHLVTVYRALGGGWTIPAEPDGETPTSASET